MQDIKSLPGKIISLPRNNFLCTEGSMDRNVYVIEEGSIRIFINDHDEERIVRFGYKGNIIVALDSFLGLQPTVFNMQALKRSLVKVIPPSEIQKFLECEENKALWMAILEDLILQQIARETDLLTASPKERYKRVLQRSPQLFQEIPNKHIANYLRMSPETLSRLKKC